MTETVLPFRRSPFDGDDLVARLRVPAGKRVRLSARQLVRLVGDAVLDAGIVAGAGGGSRFARLRELQGLLVESGLSASATEDALEELYAEGINAGRKARRIAEVTPCE